MKTDEIQIGMNAILCNLEQFASMNGRIVIVSAIRSRLNLIIVANPDGYPKTFGVRPDQLKPNGKDK